MDDHEEHSLEQPEEIQDEEVAETEIDLSSLTEEEKDALILEMQQQEIMIQKESLITEKPKARKRKKLKKGANKSIAPGFGWVAIKMGSAMTFSMVFIFLGPLLIIMALFKTFNLRGVYDWQDLLWGLVGIGLTIAAYFLFRYIIKD